MPIDAERWPLVKELFGEIAELPTEQRAARLMAVDDVAVRAEVAALLRAGDAVSDRFERAPALPADALAAEESVPGMLAAGLRVGPYRIVREIGRGGMGLVFEARRDDAQFEKRVALKAMLPGLVSGDVVRRFGQERQILAHLEHHNIAALLDAGVTGYNQPYFIMEYVEGEPISQYCTARRVPVRDRLQLMRQVCDAVQYAHEQLVVHRDLKPGNIFVTADGTVKLLDFGIAKLMQPIDGAGASETRTGHAPMTEAYASPEQLAGGHISTASDIYSLGVVLFELLAGRRPFDAGDGFFPARHADAEPPAPSRVATDTAAATSDAGDARRLQRALDGELDSIVLMALRPEPDRRYHSAQQLSEDIGRYLAGRPVLAQPDTLRYRLRKFTRRNRFATAAAALAVAALVAGTVVSVMQARTARAERDRAIREALRTQAVTQFFQQVFAAARPQRKGTGVTVVQAIDAAIPGIDSSFTDQPDLQAAIKLTLGETLTRMYLYDRARPLLEDAYRIRQRLDGGRATRDAADIIYDLAQIENEIGKPARAESLYRVSLAMLGALPDRDSVVVFETLANIAEAEMSQGRLAQAESLYRAVAGGIARWKPRDEQARAIAVGNHATALTQLGRFVEAEPLHREAVRLFEHARGPNDLQVAASLQPLAGNLIYQRKFDDALVQARRAYDLNLRALGPENPATLGAEWMVTGALVDGGRCAEAMPLVRGMVALRGRVLHESDPTLGVVYTQLGQCTAAGGDLEGGERILEEAVAMRAAALGADHWAVQVTRSLLGEVIARRGRAGDAEPLLRNSYEALLRTLEPHHIRVLEARDRLATLYRTTGREAEANALAK